MLLCLSPSRQGVVGPLRGGANERFADYVHGSDGAWQRCVRGRTPRGSRSIDSPSRPGQHGGEPAQRLAVRQERRPVHCGLRE